MVFDVPINQNTQLSLVKETRISNAYIYLNNTAVTTDLTLPAKTPLQANYKPDRTGQHNRPRGSHRADQHSSAGGHCNRPN